MTIDFHRRIILIGALAALCATVLSGNFVAYALWQAGLVVVGLIALWVLGWWRGWTTPVDLGLAGVVGLAALGTIVSAGSQTAAPSALLMLVTTACALGVWDLMRFDLRQRAFSEDLARLKTENENETEVEVKVEPRKHSNLTDLEPGHLRRVLVVAGAGLVAGVLALVLRTQLTFTWIAGIVLLALVLFALSLRELRKDA